MTTDNIPTPDPTPEPFGFDVTWWPDTTREEAVMPPSEPYYGPSPADRARAKRWLADAIEAHEHAVTRIVRTPAHWTVTLPHQCSLWVITDTPDVERAAAELERFIAEAQAALDAMRAGYEFPRVVPEW